MKECLQNLTLALASSIFGLLLLEITLRWFVVPSELSYGTLFGRELPPLRIIADSSVPPLNDLRRPYDHLVVDGQTIAFDDLLGIHKEDPVLVFTNKENSIFTNGWWQSNNIGARSRSFATSNIPAGKIRLLVFGDSFGHGSRVPQEETWSSILGSSHDDIEIMNLAVDGYSMAQAFLRYQQNGNNPDYNVILLMFVPDIDLWRDINTVRDLGESGWDFPVVVPRFVIDDGQLRLIASPYRNRAEFYADNGRGLSQGLAKHLAKYDRFYFAFEHEKPTLLGKSVVYKFAETYYRKYLVRNIMRHLMDPDAEAVQVSKAIFEAMRNKVERHGRRFVLAILPGEIWQFRDNPDLVQKWAKMIAAICDQGMPCIDLLGEFRAAPEAELDRGYDGSHYGPKTNRLIAKLVGQHLVAIGVLK